MAQKDGFLKSQIKKLLGISPINYLDNTTRNKVNDMLREAYLNKEPIFDLAKYEATLPDGTRAFFKEGNNKIYVLNSRYTDDGGHLNEFGRRIVAEQFLIFLVRLFQ